MSEHAHDQVPEDPANGDRFTCERCGVSCEFVVLDDGRPGEWVDVTPAPPRNYAEQRALLEDSLRDVPPYEPT